MNNYFNTFKIFDSKNQVLYRKLTFEEVYQMIINEERGTLINESVFDHCPSLVKIVIPFIGRTTDATGIQGLRGVDADTSEVDDLSTQLLMNLFL